MEAFSNGLPAKLLLLLTVVMSTNMSGCRGTAGAESSSDNTTSVATSSVSITTPTNTSNDTKPVTKSYEEMSLFDIQEWKIEDVANDIVIDNHKFPLPYNIDNLPEKFTIIKEDATSDSPTKLQYNNETIAELTIKNNNIVGMVFHGNAMMDYNVTVGNIAYDSTLDDILSNFGDSNVKDRDFYADMNMIRYYFPNGRLVLIYNYPYSGENEKETIGTLVNIQLL